MQVWHGHVFFMHIISFLRGECQKDYFGGKGSKKISSKVVFHQRVSSIKGCLPTKVVFQRRLSSEKGGGQHCSQTFCRKKSMDMCIEGGAGKGLELLVPNSFLDRRLFCRSRTLSQFQIHSSKYRNYRVTYQPTG